MKINIDYIDNSIIFRKWQNNGTRNRKQAFTFSIDKKFY